MNPARFEIVSNTADAITIRDVGPWDQFATVTNNPESVFEALGEHGVSIQGKRVFYYESEGQLDELLNLDGQFVGFAPGSR